MKAAKLVALLLCNLTNIGAALPSADNRQADVLIRNGLIYDGSGDAPIRGGVAIRGERVVELGDVTGWHASREIDAKGLAVAPGFINMLSWANESLIQDGRSLSDLKQGVTLEIFGEGESMGPLNARMKAMLREKQVDIHYEVTWTTLGEYLDQLAARGVSTNIASFVGAATVRTHEMGDAARAPTSDELRRMQSLVRQAMHEGALGVSSSLIYAPGVYAKTPELRALVAAGAEMGGGYISHMRSEGNRLLESLDELIDIAGASGIHGEAYHLKAAGESNWPKMALAQRRIEAARQGGLDISADMYSYTAGATGLDAAMPPWVQEGGLDDWIERLKRPDIRRRVAAEMRAPAPAWENLLLAAGSPDRVVMVSFKDEKLKPLTGKTLAEVAQLRHESPEETAIDLVIEDHTRVGTVYFLMSEDNVKRGLSQPWVSLGSDEASEAPEGPFLRSRPHPRAYGNVARFLGHYVRDEHVTSLPDAIRRLTRLPAQNWKLQDRGCIDADCYADVVIFDPATISDHATYDSPQQFATGVRDVFVNGRQVLRDGEHTGAKPGQVVRGPGWDGWKATPRPAAADPRRSALHDTAGVRLQWGVAIPMRDAIHLNATVYLPASSSVPSPCVFTLTPYISDSYHDRGMYFAARGLPFVAVDVRGRGNSQGSFRPFSQEAHDGYDVVEWLAGQPFCNGKVGMWGGSYAGYDQWATAKEFPPHLATIVPAASPYIGVDFPMRNNIFFPYDVQWLTFTSGRALQAKIFGDDTLWASLYRRQFEALAPFNETDRLMGIKSSIFQEWVAHPHLDSYWDNLNPTSSQYSRIDIPILTITGTYDDDQQGALEHYRQYMKNTSVAGRERHYLIIGPWDHAGTRSPKAQFGGLAFGPASLVDLSQLHMQWYSWTMQGGAKPEFLKNHVAYYLMGADQWRYADTLEAITDHSQAYFLRSTHDVTDVTDPGYLDPESSPVKSSPDRFVYDPRDISGAPLEAAVDTESLTDQRLLRAADGKQVVYQTAVFEHDTQISGFFSLSAWLSIDRPDTDFRAAVYEIDADGNSILLSTDQMRARYREGLRQSTLIRTAKPLRYDFDRFTFVSRQLARGSRLRLVIGPINSIYSEKNYNGEGTVASQSMQDAAVVAVALYHDRAHPSALYVPFGKE